MYTSLLSAPQRDSRSIQGTEAEPQLHCCSARSRLACQRERRWDAHSAPICQLQCCCTYFCASCAARAQWSVIGARGDGTAAEDPRESDRVRHGGLQTSPRAPKRQADRWTQSAVAGCQRPPWALSRGQRARAARAYRSGRHDAKARCGTVVVGRPPGQCPGLAVAGSTAAKEPPVRLRLSGERRARMDADCGAERYAAEAP
jgi:hypothetical protein